MKVLNWEWYTKRKLHEKLNVIFGAFIALFLGLIFFLYQFVIRTNLTNYAIQNNKDTLMSIGGNFQAKVDYTNTLSKQIMINSVITEYLNAENGKEILLNAAANRTIDEFFSVVQEDINSIYVFRLDGDYIKISNGMVMFAKDAFWKESLQQKIFQKEGSYFLSFSGEGAFAGKNGDDYLTFYRLINDISSQMPVGILAINMDLNVLDDCINGLSKEIKGFCFIDEHGNVILEDNWDSKTHNIEIDSTSYGVTNKRGIFQVDVSSYYRMPGTDITVLSYETINLLSMMTKEVLFFVVILVVFVMIIFSILRYFVKYSVTDPIEKMVASMEEVKQGGFHKVRIHLPNDEIGQLKDSYNEMVSELKRLLGEVIEKEKIIQKAELDILQEQIKPHFLYNTIDMIANLALEEEAEETFDALETLGDFYRRFLNNGSEEVSIEEEIEIVKDYLKLQKLRYGDIFEDIYEIEEGLEELNVPKLILQPLVENSLYHGIRLKGEKGIIRISLYQTEDNYVISVYDTGIGMSKEIMEKIKNAHDFRNFGIKGTIERIRYYYDFNCNISINSEESKYTEIKILIPKDM